MAALLAVVGDGDRGVGEFGDCRLRKRYPELVGFHPAVHVSTCPVTVICFAGQLWYPVSVTVLYLFLQVTFNGGLVLDYIYRLNQVKY